MIKTDVLIIGAGAVGATVANDLMIQGVASEIVLVDINKKKAAGEAMDIYQGAPFHSPAIVRSGDYSALAGADIATVPYKVIEQMTKHPLTDQGIEKFKKDYIAVFGE